MKNDPHDLDRVELRYLNEPARPIEEVDVRPWAAMLRIDYSKPGVHKRTCKILDEMVASIGRPVNISHAEEAMLAVPGEDEDGYKSYREMAKACAAAWGLKYVE